MLTYLQLIILSFLAEELVDDPQKLGVFFSGVLVATLSLRLSPFAGLHQAKTSTPPSGPAD